jgi:putative ABC transport system ATP-binding protein
MTQRDHGSSRHRVDAEDGMGMDGPVIEEVSSARVAPTPKPGAEPAPGRPSAPAPRRPERPGSPAIAPRGAEIVCDGLVRIYKVADLEVVALQGLELRVRPGEMIAIVGASGSGKSTLLNILGGLDAPSAGQVVVAGRSLSQIGERERTTYRRTTVGFVWQQTARNLLPYLSAVENVELPMVLDGRAGRRERALELLGLVGLADHADRRPAQLSGGEQQRVAIAVALANDPPLLLADEPTGELDSATAAEIFELLRRVNGERGTTIVTVTHDPLVAEHVQRTVAIRDGRTSTETVRRSRLADDGVHVITAEEFAVLDRAGRLQLPRAHVEALGLAGRVRLVMVDDHIEIWPDVDGHPGDHGHPDEHGHQRDQGPGSEHGGPA